MTRELRTASCGTCDEPKERPSRVMLLAVGAWPATEKPAEAESLPVMLTTPGAVRARLVRSEASSGRRAAWSVFIARSTEPGAGRSPSRGTFCRAWTVTAASTVGLVVMRMVTIRRSSSACRATITVEGASPSDRVMTRYWPPPSGNRTVNLPEAFVRARRVTFDSMDVTSTAAPSSGVLVSARMTVPVMMSVEAPIWARAIAGESKANARRARRTSGARKRPAIVSTSQTLGWYISGDRCRTVRYGDC
jgi:hypothetical protein